MTDEGRVTASANIGFAIATIKAFMEPPGVQASQVQEALARLDTALEIIETYERTAGFRSAASNTPKEQK